MYIVRTMDPSGRTWSGDAVHGTHASYGDANRRALARACEAPGSEPGHVTYVINDEAPERVLVAYVSLAALRHGKVSMVDDCCGGQLCQLPGHARSTVEWFRAHYAREVV